MKLVQDKLVERYPELEETIIDVESAHLTLMVMHLGETGTAVPLCIDLLNSSIPLLREKGLLKPIVVRLKDLGTFNKKVLFLKVDQGEALDRIADISHILADHLSSGGIVNNGNSFVGHLTLAKLSKLSFRRSQKAVDKPGGTNSQARSESNHQPLANSTQDGKKSIKGSEPANNPKEGTMQVNQAKRRLWSFPENSYVDFMQMDAGSTRVTEVQLCRIKSREPGSYYHVEARIPLDDVCADSNE